MTATSHKPLQVGDGSAGKDSKMHSAPDGTSRPGTAELQLAELLEQLLAFRDRPRLVDLHVADGALAIEHVGGALVHAALLVEDAVGLADRAVRPEVGQQGEGHAAQLLSPALQ